MWHTPPSNPYRRSGCRAPRACPCLVAVTARAATATATKSLRVVFTARRSQRPRRRPRELAAPAVRRTSPKLFAAQQHPTLRPRIRTAVARHGEQQDVCGRPRTLSWHLHALQLVLFGAPPPSAPLSCHRQRMLLLVCCLRA